MPEKPRLVVDTNVLVSRLLSRGSVATQAVQRAMATSQLIVSSETVHELEIVLSRPKFAPYITQSDRQEFLHLLSRVAMRIDNIPTVSVCRDRKDDKFLALAIAGRATILLTGDHDLLALHPFQEVAIVSPRQYLDQQ